MSDLEARKIDFRIFRDINSHEALYPAGSEILIPGRTSNMMYIVKKGVVAVRVGDTVVEQISEGGIFGEMGIVDPQPHSASVVALTDVALHGVTEQQFLQLIRSTPTFALRVMRVLARRTRAMNAKLRDFEALFDQRVPTI
jgi:CRP/FNR family transcriptional regulator, cyclic AMP receptor protein